MSDQKREQENKDPRVFKFGLGPDGQFWNPRFSRESFPIETIHAIEKKAYDKAILERDAAIAERDKMFVSWEASVFLEKETLNKHAQLEKDAQGLVAAIKNIPDAIRMEELARNWQSFDKKNRHAQHFYEGMLHMRSYILEALKAWEGREK